MSYSKVTTEVCGALKSLFDQRVHDPTYQEIAGQLLWNDPNSDNVPLRFTAWIKGSIATVKAVLLEEGIVIIPLGYPYYEPKEEDGGLGAGREIPEADEAALIHRCMAVRPTAGVLHCLKPNPLLEYTNDLRARQMVGMAKGFGQKLRRYDALQLLGPGSKRLISNGGLKLSLN